MTAKVDRASKLLDLIAQRTGLTTDGKKWLILALDPFHDEKLELSGYPDRETAPSVVQNVVQMADITIPATFDASKPWGFHVMLDDNAVLSGTNDCTYRSGVNHVDFGSATKIMPIGGLNVVAFEMTNSATPTWQVNPSDTVPNVITNALALNPKYLVGKSRVISQAFEIENTTPELFLGGSVVSYEAAESKCEHSAWSSKITQELLNPEDVKKFGAENIFVEQAYWEEKPIEKHPSELPLTLANENCPLVEHETTEKVYHPKKYYTVQKGVKTYLMTNPQDVLTVRSLTLKNTPPDNDAVASLLPGTRVWNAKHGVYAVQTMSDMNNPASFLDTRGSLYIVNDQLGPTQTPNPSTTQPAFTDPPAETTTYNLAESSYFVGSAKTAKTIPFHRKGAIFTGLDPKSTFKLRFASIVERVVSWQEPDLVVIASPSPGEDQVATALYTMITRTMPVAVKFNDNGFGDWFLGVVDEIANVVSSVGKPIMAAVSGYQTSRQNSSQPPALMPAQAKGPGKVKKSKNIEKGDVVVSGPRMESGKFSSPESKLSKKAKRRAKMSAQQS